MGQGKGSPCVCLQGLSEHPPQTQLLQGLSCGCQAPVLSNSLCCWHQTPSQGPASHPTSPSLGRPFPACCLDKALAAPTKAEGMKTRDLGPSPTCSIGRNGALHNLWLANKELQGAAAPSTQMLADPAKATLFCHQSHLFP